MKIQTADKLLKRPLLEQRWVTAITPHGKHIGGLLICHDGRNGTVRRLDGKKDFVQDLDLIRLR